MFFKRPLIKSVSVVLPLTCVARARRPRVQRAKSLFLLERSNSYHLDSAASARIVHVCVRTLTTAHAYARARLAFRRPWPAVRGRGRERSRLGDPSRLPRSKTKPSSRPSKTVRGRVVFSNRTTVSRRRNGAVSFALRSRSVDSFAPSELPPPPTSPERIERGRLPETHS